MSFGIASHSELVAHANGGVDVVRGEVAAGRSVMHAAVHGAHVSVEVLGEPVVGVEGKSVQASAAGAVRDSRAVCLFPGAIRTLMVAVICRGQVEVRTDAVAYAGPIHLHDLLFGVRRVVDESQNVTADVI